MKIEPFKMERMQSTWEFVVTYNLSESGVHPIPLKELITQEEENELLSLELGYCQTNGTQEIRETISRLYPGSNPEQILVTNGSAEANFILVWSNIEPGDEVLFMLPNYMQMWGLLRGFGAAVKPYYLREELSWAPDLEELKQLVTKKTKMIVVTNPNNPTGAVLSEEAMKTIIELAEGADAWILSDEVYQGAEFEGEPTPSFYGRYEKAIVVNGLSKAYGLPGLRTGWIVASEDFIKKTWSYHDYTTISLSILSDRLARIALTPENREKIRRRTQSILKSNFPKLESWLKEKSGLFEFVPPRAGAIAFVRYNLGINSTELVNKLIHEKSVLVVPGDHFEMDHYLRIGFGEKEKKLLEALELIGETLDEMKKRES
ncbi:MAG: aminotransferase class I/II-fold pyridoxal phosphate-dependent enzyme [Candidatus Aminicenantes bacterium]|nr:aminotransferase class I/II-fold pyridoxal phosphate-dependent enzyme [Candidatus Aminicenantes bacterium]